MTEISRESLLRIPLVRQLMTDENFGFIPRAIDNHWVYNQIIPIRVAGFNPFLNGAFFANKSAFASWLPAPWKSARILNQDDELVYEVLFAIHDYLHFWCARAICSLRPELGFGTKPINKKNFEDFIFCHLVTEAAATAGLDYWHLGTLDLNHLCEIGTTRKNLTVPYRIEDEPEYARFNPAFTAQNPGFFEWLVNLYLSGKPKGFDSSAMHDSPKIKRWLDKEIVYGKSQRMYSRGWLSYLSGETVDCAEKVLPKPVGNEEPWKRALVRDIGERLWVKVKKNEGWESDGKFDPEEIWRSNPKRPSDLRYLNLNRLSAPAALRSLKSKREDEAKHAAAQWICRHDFESFDSGTTERIEDLFTTRQFAKIPSLLRSGRKIQPLADEPRDVFVLN